MTETLYNQNDLDLFKNNISGIMKKIENIVTTNYTPTNKEIVEVQKIILQFARDTKRKLYGGFGLHLAIKEKNPQGSFYKDSDSFAKDIDLYSPEPLYDIVKLADILKNKGYDIVFAREALHSETYSIEVNKRPYCDFSYVPKNIYNRMPFVEINGIHVVHPTFMAIDYMKMFSDPILSSFRWDKSFERFFSLLKYYPIKHSSKKLELEYKMPKDIYKVLNDFCINNKSIAVTGFGAYNMYTEVSKIDKDYMKPLEFPYFEFASIDYENDVKKIVELLQKIDVNKVKIQEFYPFFTFTNHRTHIVYDGKVVAKVYKNLDNICFSKVSYKNITYGAFLYNLRLCLVNAIYERVNRENDRNNDKEQFYYGMASHLIQMRNFYFLNAEKTMFDNSVFQDFVIECMGVTQNDKIYHDIQFKTHRRVVFKYTPRETKIDLSKWVFMNSSGNAVNNPKNLKIHFGSDSDDEKIHIMNKKILEEVTNTTGIKQSAKTHRRRSRTHRRSK